MALVAAPRAEAQLSVDYQCTPGDCTGWYQSDVSIDWTVLPSGAAILAGCQDKTLTTDTTGSVEYCSAQFGQSKKTAEVTITVDKTLPVVIGGQPVRGPDFGGWYNHPVAIAFSGSDLTSGIDSCTAPTYGGPDSGAGSVFGTCVDKAGNVSSPFAFSLSYDATAPPLAGLDATTGDRRVVVRWQTTSETEAVEVVRSPGLDSAASSVVFRGPGQKFQDERVKNRKRYVYEVRVRDAAGNTARQTVAAKPRPHLVSPARLRLVERRRPPLLRWTPVRRATYYNVQVFRHGRKVLSAWPSEARYRLKRRWTYQGERRRLRPGRYRWVVWPGYGPRSEGNYGKRLGPTAFRISR